jgi:hypothetical protein
MSSDQKKIARLERFFYNPIRTEHENFKASDLEHISAYFEPELLAMLKKLKF